MGSGGLHLVMLHAIAGIEKSEGTKLKGMINHNMAFFVTALTLSVHPCLLFYGRSCLTLDLKATGSVQTLAGEVSCHWACKEDISGGNLDRHTRSLHWSLVDANSLQHLWLDTLGGWLKRSPDDTGSNSVDSDTLWRLLLSKSTGEGLDGTFGGAVVDQLWVTHVTGDGPRVDDRVTTLHVWQAELGHGHHVQDVGLEGLLDDIQVNVRELEAGFLHGG